MFTVVQGGTLALLYKVPIRSKIAMMSSLKAHRYIVLVLTSCQVKCQRSNSVQLPAKSEVRGRDISSYDIWRLLYYQQTVISDRGIYVCNQQVI